MTILCLLFVLLA
uniref:Uncharacterized protein n=1 Tax=Anguilla anguilla TaxID=7936 RepID=A0A0E9PTA5_ANGAN